MAEVKQYLRKVTRRDNMDIQKLFWSIFSANNEEALHKIVMSNELLSNNDNWFPYGGQDKNDRSNFGTFDNQQSNPIPALIEKATNSIDTLLLKKCRINEIDPESDAAPQNMANAVEMFFGIKNGDFSEISRAGRRSIAEDIQLIAEGDKSTPNIIVYDNGEGQHPDDFPDTFLSISKCNKTNIPFVQGKYNMGSTGGVIFCGEYRYQLIASKLCDDLNKRKSNDFGFTLVRKHPLTESEEKSFKGTWYEYFTVNGVIPRFPIKKPIDIGLYKRNFITGSIVKMYSYGLPRGSTSSVVWDLWRDLNQYLYHPALPFIVYEKRGYDKKTPSKPVLGNKIRLTLDERGKKEKTVTTSLSDSELGEINVEVHVFNPNVNQKEFINNKALVFTLNGQVHGFYTRSFISQKLGFSLLRDHMLIQVDCTKMKTSYRQDLFKGSRDRLNEGKKTESLIDKLIGLLKNNEQLKELNQNRRNRILRESLVDKEILSEVFSSIPLDKELLKLLKQNEAFNMFKLNKKTKPEEKSTKTKEDKAKRVSKRFPSIFKINIPEDEAGKRVKSIPLKGKGVIQFETDVEDEYFFRPKEKGEIEISILDYNQNDTGGGDEAKPSKVEDVFNVTTTGPTDNSIRITFEPKDNLNVGDEIELNAKLSSPDGDLESIFWVRVTKEQKEREKKKDKKKDDEVAPPIPIRVFQNAEGKDDKTWADYDWDGNDVVKVITTPTETGKIAIEAIAVNMDCFALKKHISRNKKASSEDIKNIKNKFFLSIYLHSLFLHGILSRINDEENVDIEVDTEDIIPILFKPYSSLLVSLGTMDGIS
jgi:hypothetical protein